MIRIVILLSLLLGCWFLFSGFFSPLFIFYGIASSVLAVVLTHRMIRLCENPLYIKLSWRFVPYLGWLLYQVILSSLSVARKMWQLEPHISPTVAWVTSSQTNDLGRTIYANSITLTPGTVSILVEENRMQVHALSQEGVTDLLKGQMDRKVAEATGGKCSQKENVTC